MPAHSRCLLITKPWPPELLLELCLSMSSRTDSIVCSPCSQGACTGGGSTWGSAARHAAEAARLLPQSREIRQRQQLKGSHLMILTSLSQAPCAMKS